MNNISNEKRKEISKKSAESRRGRKATDQHRQNISNSLKGRSFSEEHKQNIRLSKQHVVLSKEALDNIAKAAKVEYTCNVCGAKVKGAGNLSRWHNDNCKHKSD